jgi:A/G-specific adenine glycosylase
MMPNEVAIDKHTISYFRRKLLGWFDIYGRHSLPWQINKTPYKVWLSEVMLQQTQVSTVIPYFNKFMQRFPNVSDLAKADLDEVLSLWAGLGYYRRARFLHACAQKVMQDYNGKFPVNLDGLIELPGIGRSTAGAIMSLSMGQKAAILDGNVKRVLSRFFAVEQPLNESNGMKHLWLLAEILTPNKRFDAYNQAMMDLGATCCTRHKPLCSECPVAKKCKALAGGDVMRFPVRPAKKKVKPKRQTQMLILINEHQQILLEKRDHSGIWPGLYSLPEADIAHNVIDLCQQVWSLSTANTQLLDSFTHQFTHFNLEINPVICEVQAANQMQLTAPENNYSWHDHKNIDKLGIPAPVKKILNSLKGTQHV